MSIHPLFLLAIDFHAWDTYFYAGVAAGIGWLIKTAITQGKDIVGLQTAIKYYVERQTQDAARRLDVANPAPSHIRALVQKHMRKEKLTDLENSELATWLKWTGTGNNPTADSAERSAALQLLTGIKTAALLKPRKRWWQF